MGSAIDAYRFSTSTLSKRWVASSRAGDLGRGVGREDRADVDPGETADFGVRRQHVAVDPDLGHDLGRRPDARTSARSSGTRARQRLAGAAGAPGMPTFDVTVASR